MFPAGGGSEHGKDSRSNYRTDAEGGQCHRTERLLQPGFRPLGVGDQLVDGLLGKKLACQLSGSLIVLTTKAVILSQRAGLLLARERRISIGGGAAIPYLLAWPRVAFFILRLREPRA